MRLAVVAALFCVASVGCTKVPRTPVYAPGVGAQYCRELASTAAQRSTEEFLEGASLMVAGLIGVGAGVGIGPSTAPDASWVERSGHLLFIASGTVVTAIGVASVMAGQKSESLAAQAANALEEKNEADRSIFYECVSARGDWSGNHTEAARIQINMFNEHLAESRAAQESASHAQTQAQSATALAADAKTTAAQAAQVASASAEATKELASATERLLDANTKNASETSVGDTKGTRTGVQRSVAPGIERAPAKHQPPPAPAPPTSPVLQQQR